MLFIDNHWYTENAIALMLVPLGVNLQEMTNQQVWPYEYSSQYCKTDLTTKLQLGAQYQILIKKNQFLKHESAEGR